MFEVLPSNWNTVRVFQASEWQILVGLGGIYYEKLQRSSIKSTLELMRIDPEKWPSIFLGLRIMEIAAKPVLNKKG